MNSIRSLSNLLDAVTKQALWLAIALMLVLTAAQVFSRYLLNHAFFWTEELVRYLFIWTSFLGASVAFKRGAHLGFVLLVDSLGKTLLGRFLTLIRDVSVLISLLILAYYGSTLTYLNASNRSITLGVSMAVPYGIIPVCAFVMLVHHIVNVVTARSPERPSGGQ
jgi:TRAP-type transport system small permease protein